MTRFSKVLVVFITAASLSYFAFIGALILGGPNWTEQANQLQNSPEFGKQVTFKGPDIPKGPWVATHIKSNSQVGSDPILAAVIIKAQERILKDTRDELADIKQKMEAETAARDLAKQTITADQAGIKVRADAYAAQLKTIRETIDRETEALSQRGIELTAVQKQFEERRFEVFRLQAQLELLRDDLYASQRQRDALQDELLQLQESQQRLEARRQQLKRQLGAGDLAVEGQTDIK
jgi:chromosome segregation ATPase